MSLKTWMQEFYPVPASKCPADKAVAHSLRRWGGFRKANIKKHRCRKTAHHLYEITDCALCSTTGDDCSGCPLWIDNNACGAGLCAFDENDPEPMIAALEKALKAQKRKPKRAAKRKGKK